MVTCTVIKANVILTTMLALTFLSFTTDLEYKEVAGGELKILIPRNFVKISTNHLIHSSQA